MATQGGFPQAQSPFTDSKGLLTRDGLNLLQLLFNRTGGTTGITVGWTDEKGKSGAIGFAEGVDFNPGTSTTLTLSQSYGSAANLIVAFDGAMQGADQFSLTGTILTFNAAIPAGISKVYVKGFLTST